MLDGRLRLNATLFWMDIAHPMVQIVTGTTLIFSNAESARSKGFEVEGLALLTDNLNLRFSGTFTNARYRSYTNAVCAPEIRSLRSAGCGRQSSATPAALPSARAEIHLEPGFRLPTGTTLGELTLSGNWSNNSGYYQQPSNDLHQAAYEIIDVSMHLALRESLGSGYGGKHRRCEIYQSRRREIRPGRLSVPGRSPRVVGATVDFRL